MQRPLLSILAFAVVMTIVVGGSHYYLWTRLVRATALDGPWRLMLTTLLTSLGFAVTDATPGYPVLRLALKDVAPILPYLLMVLILIFRPKGLLGTRED